MNSSQNLMCRNITELNTHLTPCVLQASNRRKRKSDINSELTTKNTAFTRYGNCTKVTGALIGFFFES